MNEGVIPTVTIDTNLVISGVTSPKGSPAKLLVAWTEGKFSWILTDDIYFEIKNVLNRPYIRDKYHIDEENAANLLDSISIEAEFVTPLALPLLPIHCRDSKDDTFLASQEIAPI